MADPITYAGGCHCGAVRFETTADLSQTIACNCSICAKAGYVLTFVPETAFKLIKGQDVLKDYQFAKKHIHHVFCATCGIHSFGHGKAPDGSEMYAINARCLDNVDVTTLSPAPYDGKSA